MAPTYQGAELAGEALGQNGQMAAPGIGARQGSGVAAESLGAGLGVQGGSPLADQLLGHEWMQHRRLPVAFRRPIIGPAW